MIDRPFWQARPDSEFYGEWLDYYFARDVQELFRLEKRTGFLRALELLFRHTRRIML